MREPRGWTGGLAAIGIVLVSLLACPSIEAAKVADPPKTLLERIDREMVRLRGQIHNGRIRYENGILGVDQGATDPGRPATPFVACCSANLKKIKGAVAELKVIFGELGRCYEDTGNMSGASSVPPLVDSLVLFDRAVDSLAAAPVSQAVDRSLLDATRVYIQIRDGVEQLDDCAGAEEEGKGKKKKSRSQHKS